jgi:hypothetical protein
LSSSGLWWFATPTTTPLKMTVTVSLPNARKRKAIADRGTWPASVVATGAFRP